MLGDPGRVVLLGDGSWQATLAPRRHPVNPSYKTMQDVGSAAPHHLLLSQTGPLLRRMVCETRPNENLGIWQDLQTRPAVFLSCHLSFSQIAFRLAFELRSEEVAGCLLDAFTDRRSTILGIR